VQLTGTAGSVGPILSLSQQVLDFGIMQQGEGKSLNLTVANEGAEELLVENWNIAGLPLEFPVTSPPASVVPPGSQTVMTISHEAKTVSMKSAVLTLETNDPHNRSVDVLIKVNDVANEITDESVHAEFVRLHDCYPNPFNPSTTIRWDLPERMLVSLYVIDPLGRYVRQLIQREMFEAGTYHVQFEAGNLTSGLYYYRLITPEASITKKMILAK
jgi:hypothetical protein